MTSRPPTKIRLVRCPKCCQILPEQPDVPVYECGCCGTRLQAKMNKHNANSTTSGLLEPAADPTNEFNRASEEPESGSPSCGPSVHSSGECSVDPTVGRDQLNPNCDTEQQLGSDILPNDGQKSASSQYGDGNFHGKQLVCGGTSDEDQTDKRVKSELGACEEEQHRDGNLSNEDEDNGSGENESLECHVEQSGAVFADSDVWINDENSDLAGVEAEPDAAYQSESNCRRSITKKLVNTNATPSSVTSHRPEEKNISSDILICSANGLPEQPRESFHHGLDRVRSTDTFETTDFVTPSSELSGTLIDLSKSPTTNSSRAYYDDGVSSCEGTDDQSPNRHRHLYRNVYKTANVVTSDEGPRRDKFPGNSNSGMQLQTEKAFCSATSNKFGRDGLHDLNGLGHPTRNWRKIERDEYPYQLPSYGRSSLAGYEFQKELYGESSVPCHDKHAFSEQKRLKLLRMVYELQDQLNQAHCPSENLNGIVSTGWKDCSSPMYYECDEKIFNNYPRCPGRLKEEGSCPQKSRYFRMLSAEAANCRHRADQSFCCRPRDQRQPGQFFSSDLLHNIGFSGVHSGIHSYSSYGSCPSTPRRNLESDNPFYGTGIKSNEQRHVDREEIKKFLREKRHFAKRHLRPIAGGAPFITCSCCLKQLQLPVDFLLLKSKCHRLKCGNCSEILRFSLLNRTHLVPSTLCATVPPPSEVAEDSDATNTRNPASASHASGHCHVDPVTCSEDYGPSCKSYSTDRDPVSETSSHAVKDGGFDRNVLHVSGERANVRNEVVLNERNKHQNSLETSKPGEPFSGMSRKKKLSSEIEKLLAGGSSPLHLLMGYSSPSEVIYGWGPSGLRTQVLARNAERYA